MPLNNPENIYLSGVQPMRRPHYGITAAISGGIMDARPVGGGLQRQAERVINFVNFVLFCQHLAELKFGTDLQIVI